jgi:hypothetical protein
MDRGAERPRRHAMAFRHQALDKALLVNTQQRLCSRNEFPRMVWRKPDLPEEPASSGDAHVLVEIRQVELESLE